MNPALPRIVMRRRRPELERPYRTFAYPLTPLVYVALAAVLVVDLAILAPQTSVPGYLIVLTGIPAYLVWRRRFAVEGERPAAVAAT